MAVSTKVFYFYGIPDLRCYRLFLVLKIGTIDGNVFLADLHKDSTYKIVSAYDLFWRRRIDH